MAFIMLSLAAMGYCSDSVCDTKLVTCMCDPNPITLAWMVCLKPNTTHTETIITARPIATPAVAMEMAGRDTLCLSPLSPYILFAM